jgi:hypothetical protein
METKTKKTTQYVHFRVGEDAGKLLTTIAQEHLIYGNDPIKALKTLTESLHGCPTDLAHKILKGDIVLMVDVDAQQFLATERNAGHDALGYPRIDVVYQLKRMRDEIVKHGEYIKTGLTQLQMDIRKNYGRFTFSFDYDTIFKFIAGNDEIILEQLRDDREFEGIENLILTTRDYIEHTMKMKSVMHWIYQTWNEFGDGFENVHEYITLKGDCDDILLTVMQKLKDTLNMDLSTFEVESNEVQNYIESARAIDEIIKEGISPVDINDNYSAGWLAPNGDFYGLNGEIANMLHIQIADALQEIGIIPDVDEHGDELNGAMSDAWLEQNGWVKIHGNNINYAGCLNDKIGGKNVDLTNVQIKKIYEYCTLCHNGIIKLGWRMEQVTATRFKDMAENNIEGMNKKYFEF